MQNKSSLPKYFDALAKQYVQKLVLGGKALPSLLENESVADVLQRCLVADDLRELWEGATQAFKHIPARGQIELARSIDHAAWLESQPLATKREADMWRDKFMKSARETLNLWKSRPVNLNVDECAIGVYECFAEKKIEGFDSVFNDYMSGEHLTWQVMAASRCAYSPLDYGAQVHSPKGRRKRFVRALSTQLQYRGMEPRVQVLARVTSVVFDCEYEESSVRDALQDYEQNESASRYLNGLDKEPADSWLNRVYSYIEG